MNRQLLRNCIYLFPALMDLVVALMIFVCTIRAAAELQASASAVAGILAVWGATYMVACAFLGRVISRQNAGMLLVAACIGSIAICTGLIYAPSLRAMYVLMGLQGVATALFFAPFQIFMAAVDEGGNKPVTWSTGLYTFSWSLGFALGPFVCSFLFRLGTALDQGGVGPFLQTMRLVGNLLGGDGGFRGWQYCYLFAILVLACNTVGILFLRHYANTAIAPEEVEVKKNALPLCDYSKMPNLAWVAWIGAGAGILALQMIRGVFPKYSDPAILGLPETSQGIIFFLLSFAQAVTGLFLCKSRWWMYRPGAVCLFGFFGIIGLLSLGLGRSEAVFYFGAIAYGIYAGSFFYYFVFHSIAHAVHAPRQVAVNEAIVGITGIAGPFIGGILADIFTISTPFLSSIGLIAAGVIFQQIMHSRKRVDQFM